MRVYLYLSLGGELGGGGGILDHLLVGPSTDKLSSILL